MARTTVKAEEIPVLAAGAVVRRAGKEGLELLLVHRPRYDDWSFPKGKLDFGEHVLAAATREVREESGFTVALRRPLPAQHYVADGRPKQVRYWVADVIGPEDGAFAPNDEVDEIAWVPVGQTADRLSWVRDRELVDAVAAEPPTTALLVVRHGKALPRHGWDGEDDARPLSDTGQRQAERLVPVLSAYAPEVVLTSDTVRTVFTVAPFAAVNGLPLDGEPLLSETGFAAAPDSTIQRARELLSVTVPTVVCSHRPVLRAVLPTLLEGSDVRDPGEQLDVGGFWVVHLHEGRALTLERHDA